MIQETNTSQTEKQEQTTTQTKAADQEVTATSQQMESSEEPEQVIYDYGFEPGEYVILEAFPNLSFDKPLYIGGAGDGDNQLYVVEKRGIIWMFPNEKDAAEPVVFLDITNRVASNNNEEGLLGLAFHPNLSENPFIYVNYSVNKGTSVSRFNLIDGNPRLADPDSEKVILSFDQPYTNHNGGHLAFGDDGYLYISSGDGGSKGDPQDNAQNLSNLLGKIIRIDVNGGVESESYRIPEDNPFYRNDSGYRQEIYAYGLRNPWKFSFDEKRDMLIAADVGQDRIEEIDVIINGGNYGWAKYEGTSEYKNMDLQGDGDYIAPIFEYEHPTGKSITGGYTYYGKQIPSLYGSYIYGDFISGRVWALWIDENANTTNAEILDTDLRIASFGLDDNGEIFIVDYRGKIYGIAEK